MEKIKVEKGRVEVRVNPIFYNRECILRTKNIFKKSAKVSMKKSGNEIIVTLKPRKKTNLGLIGYEFYNHLLNAIKEIRLGL